VAYFAQLLFQGCDRRVAFALVACCDYEDEGFVLGTRLQKFVDQAGTDSEAETAATMSMSGYTIRSENSPPVRARDQDVEAVVGRWYCGHAASWKDRRVARSACRLAARADAFAQTTCRSLEQHNPNESGPWS
jgi:hypothetical protein